MNRNPNQKGLNQLSTACFSLWKFVVLFFILCLNCPFYTQDKIKPSLFHTTQTQRLCSPGRAGYRTAGNCGLDGGPGLPEPGVGVAWAAPRGEVQKFVGKLSPIVTALLE